MDELSIQRANLLHPKRRSEALVILSEIDKKTTTPTSFCRYAFTLRTIKEQNEIYAQGRTKPGQIVTQAKGGLSFHNYGLAIDIAWVIKLPNGQWTGDWNTKKDWDKDNKADWLEVVEIFKAHGWEWGDRGYVDLPHFQKVEGTTPSQLFKLVQAGKVDKDGYVIF